MRCMGYMGYISCMGYMSYMRPTGVNERRGAWEAVAT